MTFAPAASLLPDAVLWDMDGTLVDTEPLWMQAEIDLVARFGGTWTHEQALTLVGNGLETSAAILQEAGVQMSVPDIIDHLTDAVMQTLIADGPTRRPGALDLLTAVRAAGVRCAMVTMSLRRMAEVVAQSFPGSPFEFIVSGDDATRPKPYPDPYLQACEQLGVNPARCVAIEDSPTGVRSAVSAGVATVGVPLMVSLVGVGAQAEWDTLEGKTLNDLADLSAAHRARLAAKDMA